MKVFTTTGKVLATLAAAAALTVLPMPSMAGGEIRRVHARRRAQHPRRSVHLQAVPQLIVRVGLISSYITRSTGLTMFSTFSV